MMLFSKKSAGLVSFSVGIGMLLALIVPTWTGVIAILLVGLGAWDLFVCRSIGSP